MSDDSDNVTRLPVEHADVGVRLVEAIKRMGPGIKAGIFIAVDDKLRATQVFLHAGDATHAHLGIVLGDIEIVKHRLIVALDDDANVTEITDDNGA